MESAVIPEGAKAKLLRAFAVVSMALALAACSADPAGKGALPGDRVPIDHVVVLFLENRSFDHLFGTYPGADGLGNYRGRQTDKDGATYATLLAFSSAGSASLLSVIEPAVAPDTPISPRPLLNVLLACVSSMVLSELNP